ncbi:MAG: hypothetical protein JW734_07775 [Candidatus Omnitrophica bacterium]|nr:hypothetical protein [Candidatus Omnitrophota bacterium]
MLKQAFLGRRNDKIKSLAERFDYPALGAGQMYEAICRNIVSQGAKIMLDTEVIRINQTDNAVKSICVKSANSKEAEIAAKYFLAAYHCGIFLIFLIRLLNRPKSKNL